MVQVSIQDPDVAASVIWKEKAQLEPSRWQGLALPGWEWPDESISAQWKEQAQLPADFACLFMTGSCVNAYISQ